MSNPVYKSLSNLPLRQITDKAGKLIIQNPFWVLLIGSLGIHGLFVLLTPSPLPKDAPTKEVTFTKLPMVQLPAKTLTPKLLPEKSLLDNLFVKPSEPKLNSPLDSLPQPLDLSNLEQFEDLPPVATNLPFGIPPLLSIPNLIAPPEFVKPQLRLPTPQNSLSNLGIASRIDNSNLGNTSSSNLRSEFQGGGIKNENNQITPAPRTSPSPTVTTPQRVAVNRPSSNLSPRLSVTPRRSTPKPIQEPIQEPPTVQPDPPSSGSDGNGISSSVGGNILALIATDKRIKNLIDKNLLVTTQIAPPETLIANPEQNREKGVAWIPPKRTDLNGKKGTIVCYWIVAPNGEIQLAGYTSGDRELVDADREMVEVVLETVRAYKFQPLENPQTGIYRFVIAKYVFS